MTTVAITTLGCKANQFDSSVILEILKEKGFSPVPFYSPADIYIINSCIVTKKAEYESRQWIRRAKKFNPSSFIIVTGCYAQVYWKDLDGMKEVDFILGNTKKKVIGDVIERMSESRCSKVMVEPMSKETSLNLGRLGFASGRTRGFLKIQDGCDSFCSFCIVPYARGKSRSVEKSQVLNSLLKMAERDFKEVVLTGIHLGAYGKDLNPKLTLLDLMEEIERLRPIQRIRLSSIEPMEISKEFIEFLANSEIFCPHLHIPLQSADREILKKMKRNYSPEDYVNLVEYLRTRIEGVSIGADVIVGFPGEGEKAFSNTVDLVKSLPITYLHVFPYSRRIGTEAASLPNPLDGNTIKERTAILREIGREKKRIFYERFLGKDLAVLVQGNKDGARFKGISRNYIPVLLEECTPNFINQEVLVNVKEIQPDGVVGNITSTFTPFTGISCSGAIYRT